MAVVGFDDIPLAEYLDPPLTTIRLPAFGLGWAAGERLIRLIRGEGLDQTAVLVEYQLIVRASSVPASQRV
jgi:DNA-binding LacI/PurR family transcriptional regulator